MEVVTGLLAVTVLTVLLLLSIPLDMAVDLRTAAPDKIRFRLIWLFGLLDLKLAGAAEEGRRNGKRKVRANWHGKRWFCALRIRGLTHSVLRLMRRLLAAFLVRDFNLSVRFGFDDPADTGLLLALAAPALSLLDSWSRNRFSALADFNEEVLCAEGNMSIRIYPLRVVVPSILFLLSPPVLRAAMAWFWKR